MQIPIKAESYRWKHTHTNIHTHRVRFSLEFSFYTPDVCSTIPTDQRQKCVMRIGQSTSPPYSHFRPLTVCVAWHIVRQSHTKLHTHTHNLDWGAFTHAAHAPQSRLCNMGIARILGGGFYCPEKNLESW